MVKPTDAELDAVKDHLLLFKPDGTTRLALPAHDASLDPRYAGVATDPRFDDLGFAIIEYGTPPAAPKTFLHNPDDAWDIGSCGKLSIAVGALALLKDVRTLLAANAITAAIPPAQLDALLQHVWTRHAEPGIRKLSISPQFPLPSKTIDLAPTPPDFQGAAAIDFVALHTLLKGGISATALRTATFSQRLHLAMGGSHNRAARSCQGALGIGFINAIHTKLGLFDESSNVGIRIAGDYAPSLRGNKETGWRQPDGISRAPGRGKWVNPKEKPPYVATARTLAALMNAVFTDQFLDAGLSARFRDLLLVRAGFSYGSYALEGVERAATRIGAAAAVGDTFSKIGILYHMTEFVHVVSGPHRYGIVILGLRNKKVGGALAEDVDRARDLGDAVHTLIKAP